MILIIFILVPLQGQLVDLEVGEIDRICLCDGFIVAAFET